MFYNVRELINPRVADELSLGGQFGEMRTRMQYLFQTFNFRDDTLPYLNLLAGSTGINGRRH